MPKIEVGDRVKITSPVILKLFKGTIYPNEVYRVREVLSGFIEIRADKSKVPVIFGEDNCVLISKQFKLGDTVVCLKKADNSRLKINGHYTVCKVLTNPDINTDMLVSAVNGDVNWIMVKSENFRLATPDELKKKKLYELQIVKFTKKLGGRIHYGKVRVIDKSSLASLLGSYLINFGQPLGMYLKDGCTEYGFEVGDVDIYLNYKEVAVVPSELNTFSEEFKTLGALK